MSKKQGYFRHQLWLSASSRAFLHQALSQAVHSASTNPLNTQVKWSLDVDPQEMG